MVSSIALPRVSAAMTDLEPPCNWSQLVLAGIGLPRDPAAFYQQLHAYLGSLGIDGVKVDVQNQLELAGSAAGQPGGQALAAAWHAALEGSVGRHFPGNQLINCMCHNTNVSAVLLPQAQQPGWRGVVCGTDPAVIILPWGSGDIQHLWNHLWQASSGLTMGVSQPLLRCPSVASSAASVTTPLLALLPPNM
eukprot:GHRQ01028646.1.p1 GENE.GHRQ01028646.1~~GHRQ01028646.1.p1  ORF type:complete len:218 (+),score=91.73 GHRQ01028646.1:81-656(+)